MNDDGSNKVQLTTDFRFAGIPMWSPDGEKIAVGALSSGWASHIWIINSDGSNTVQLTTSKESNLYPIWSPDGTKIAFTSDPDGNIWMIPIEEITTPAKAATPTSTTMVGTPAFDAAIAIFGLLIVIYIVRRR